jgi:hypothetical protein
MDCPWSKPRGDIELPNEGGRSPSNPHPEVVKRRAASKTPDVGGALRQALGGAKILSDKGLTGKRSPSGKR